MAIKTTRIKTVQAPEQRIYDLLPAGDKTFKLPFTIKEKQSIYYLLVNNKVFRNSANKTYYTVNNNEITLNFDYPDGSTIQLVYTDTTSGSETITRREMEASSKEALDKAKEYTDSVGAEVEKLKQGKVDKVDGKQLSTNNYTNDDKNKLAGLETGAQVNIIEHVRKTDGSELAIEDKSVTLPDFALRSEISSVYNVRGSLANLDEIKRTANPRKGDVYNAEDTGMNYVWTGESWDGLGSSIDLSPYSTTAQNDAKYVHKDGNKKLTTNDFTDDYKSKLDELASSGVNLSAGKGIKIEDGVISISEDYTTGLASFWECYVDSETGDDNNTGTKDSKLRTLGKAFEIIQKKYRTAVIVLAGGKTYDGMGPTLENRNVTITVAYGDQDPVHIESELSINHSKLVLDFSGDIRGLQADHSSLTVEGWRDIAITHLSVSSGVFSKRDTTKHTTHIGSCNMYNSLLHLSTSKLSFYSQNIGDPVGSINIDACKVVIEDCDVEFFGGIAAWGSTICDSDIRFSGSIKTASNISADSMQIKHCNIRRKITSGEMLYVGEDNFIYHNGEETKAILESK